MHLLLVPKRLTASAVVVALFLFAGSLSAADKPTASASVPEVVSGNSQFAIDLYKKLTSDNKTKEKNIFASPYSISTALAMTYAGSRGNTQKQMAAVLHFSVAEPKLHEDFQNLLGQTKAPNKSYQLSVANALWGQQDYHFEEGFLGLIRKHYDGGFNTVDYVRAIDKSRSTINQWVENKTANKIKDLIHDGDLSADTRLVLTNAIYFKGDWAAKFKKDATKPEPFTVVSGKTVSVPMMAQTAHFPYAENDDLQVIELPYAGDDLSMLVLLPKKGIDKLDASLSLAQLQELKKKLRDEKVAVALPKFKFETRYYLEDSLKGMGMPDAFSDADADFSGMTGNRRLRIAHVIHQAMIDVNEEGSEAAAATAVIMDTKSFSMTQEFRADHPFVFAIVHKATDSILFIGRVSNPSGS